MALIFPETDILKILTNRKSMTCRNYPLKVGHDYKLMSNFKIFATVTITNVTYIEDVNKLNHETIKKLGFKTKKEYLNQFYNVSNNNNTRYLIEFEIKTNEILNYIDKWM